MAFAKQMTDEVSPEADREGAEVSLRRGPLAALTVHRTVIHSRSCRFATRPYENTLTSYKLCRGGRSRPPENRTDEDICPYTA